MLRSRMSSDPPDGTVVSRLLHASSGTRPYLTGDRPWWDDLDPEFWRLQEPFDLEEGRDIRAIRATALTDHAIRVAFASLLTGVALPFGYHPGRLGQVRRELDHYGPLAERGDPHAFFAAPPPGVEVRRKRLGWTGFRPWDGAGEELSFVSDFVPNDPALRDRWGRHRRNRIARARHWRHRHGPRPTLVAVHGFAAEAYAVNEWFFNLPWLYGMGCDVVLVTLPFHGRRQGPLSPFSGHGFFSRGLGWTNEAFAQAVFDLRVLIRHLLDERGVPQVGVMGVSLGGHTAALLAAVEPRIAFAVPTVPVASLVDLVLQWEPMGSAARALLKVSGLTVPELRRLAAVSCPLTWEPVVPPDRRMIIGGAGDRLAPPKHTRLLWEHWDRCRIHWFPGSHLLHLDRGAYLWQLARFLRSVEFLSSDHPAPERPMA